jgi:ABC-type spermidine/putrescine transport system permease subunit II
VGHRLPLRPDRVRGVLTQLLHIAPLALAFSLPIALLGALLLRWLRHRALAASMTVLVLVPLLATLVGCSG